MSAVTKATLIILGFGLLIWIGLKYRHPSFTETKDPFIETDIPPGYFSRSVHEDIARILADDREERDHLADQQRRSGG